MTVDPNMVAIAKAIEELQRQVDGIARNGAALQHSSIEDGAVDEYDAEGNLVSSVGKQFDGTHVAASLSGPTPPTPTMAVVIPTIGGFRVVWDGLFTDAIAAPMDFSRTEIQASTDPDFGAEFSYTLRGTFESPRGGEQTVALPDDEWYFRLVTRSQSGKPSAPSEVTGPLSPGKVALGDLDFDPSQFGGGTKVHYGDIDPTTDQATTVNTGDLWLQIVDNTTTPPKVVTNRWDGIEWVQAQDQGISQALYDAALANEAANSKSRVLARPDDPSQDATITLSAGDVWMDTDDGNRMRTWDGAAWQDRRLGNGSIEPGSLVARDVIATGSISTGLLEAFAVTADKIAADAITADKILAGAVTAGKINTGAVTADKIDALAVTAGKIAANAVTGEKISATAIDGKTITGAKYRTAASGQRWELDSVFRNELRAYSGLSGEIAPGMLRIAHDTEYTYLELGPANAKSGSMGLLTIFRSRLGAGGGVQVEGALEANYGILSTVMRPSQSLTGAAMNTSSATYTWVGAGEEVCTFTAPPSGCVKVTITALCRSQVLRQYLQLDYRIRRGSSRSAGTIDRDLDTSIAGAVVTTQNDIWEKVTGSSITVGLLPGTAYNCTPMFRSYSGQAVSTAGVICIVEPMLGY